MFIFMYFYIIFLSFIILRIKQNNRYELKRSKLIFIALLFGLFSVSLGMETSPDRLVYEKFFIEIPIYYNTLNGIFNMVFEPGFVILNLVISKFTSNIYWVFFIVSFSTVLIDLFVINKLKINTKSIIIYYMLGIQIFYGTFLCRQIIAVSIVNLAFLYFYYNKKNICFILLLIATLFHSTAYIMLIVFMLMSILKTKKNAIIYSLIIIIFSILFFVPLASIIVSIPSLNKYLGDLDITGTSSRIAIIFKGLPYHLITLFAVIERHKISKNLKYSNIFIIFSILNSAFWIISPIMYWVYRLSFYVMLPTIILIPYIIESTNYKNKKNIYKISIIGSLVLITLREIAITMY